MFVHTACSTSLVAIHMAGRSLLNGESNIALAGGVTLKNINEGYLYREGMIMSPDGHCRAFDARAKGTVGGEGTVGVAPIRDLVSLEPGVYPEARPYRETLYARVLRTESSKVTRHD